MHDTEQLRRCGERDPFISKTFLGVFPADKIPANLESRPCCLIANTDPADQPGQHWIALIVRSNGDKIFIDSYGNKPSYYNPVLWRRFAHWQINTYDLQQNLSTVCGDWCLYFLRVLCRNGSLSIHGVVKQFDVNDDAGNDAVIKKAIHKLYPDILQSEPHPNIPNMQICTSRA